MKTNEKFNHKYRIASARKPHWDYRNAGAYFITICTNNRIHYFGEIEDGKMNLSNVGVLADVCWYEIKHHSKNVTLGEFVVMPNHIHGILILDNDNTNVSVNTTETIDTTVSVAPNDLETLHATSLQNKMAVISPKSNSISTIIRSYKSSVTKHVNRLGFKFEWQSRFHDIIVKDDHSFNTISNYIRNNIRNWNEDKFYKQDNY